VVLALVLLCVLLHGDFAESKVYTVGDRAGWTLSSGGWSRGKKFRAGDVLRECSPSPSCIPHELFFTFCFTLISMHPVTAKKGTACTEG
jgi:hypothetical protein